MSFQPISVVKLSAIACTRMMTEITIRPQKVPDLELGSGGGPLRQYLPSKLPHGAPGTIRKARVLIRYHAQPTVTQTSPTAMITLSTTERCNDAENSASRKRRGL